jgi:hypothetical protein
MSGSLLPLRVRKLPVEVEAMQFTRESYGAVRDWLGKSFGRVAVMNGGPSVIRIKTLEGVMAASRGDWIVKGVKGEFYPVKPDIFEQTYEVLDS